MDLGLIANSLHSVDKDVEPRFNDLPWLGEVNNKFTLGSEEESIVGQRIYDPYAK